MPNEQHCDSSSDVRVDVTSRSRNDDVYHHVIATVTFSTQRTSQVEGSVERGVLSDFVTRAHVNWPAIGAVSPADAKLFAAAVVACAARVAELAAECDATPLGPSAPN